MTKASRSDFKSSIFALPYWKILRDGFLCTSGFNEESAKTAKLSPKPGVAEIPLIKEAVDVKIRSNTLAVVCVTLVCRFQLKH